MSELKDIDIELAKFLLEKAEEKRGLCTYKGVAEELSKRLGRTVNPYRNLTKPLGNVMELCYNMGLPLITVMVRHSGGKETVGEGFYKLACDLRPEYKNLSPDAVLQEEIYKVWKCQDWSALKNYLNKF